MMEKERADLQNIARRLQVISDELNGLKKAIGGSSIEQAALSAAMALAWIDLLEAKKAHARAPGKILRVNRALASDSESSSKPKTQFT